jgi:3-oxoacyl-[acyl-carrier protein] reductase
MEFLKNRVAIITGATGAIGRVMSLTFSKLGASLVICGTNQQKTNELVSELKSEGGKAISVVTDVSDFDQVMRMVDKVVEAFGRIDILVNNAVARVSRDHQKKTILEIDKSEWDRMISVNLTGIFNCSKLVIPWMIKAGGGNILNISSTAAKTGGLVSDICYVASKAGMGGMTKKLAREFASQRIRVNTLSLGRIETPVTVSVPPEYHEKIISLIPLGRIGKAEEVAHAAAFLVSDYSSYITGANIDINGGWLMD